jgi:hypothetical protein
MGTKQVVTSASEVAEYMGYRLEARPLGKGWRVLIYPPGTNSGCRNMLRKRLLSNERKRLSIRISIASLPDRCAVLEMPQRKRIAVTAMDNCALREFNTSAIIIKEAGS